MLQYFDVEVIDSVVYRALDNKWVSNSLHLLIISKRESYNQRYLVKNFRSFKIFPLNSWQQVAQRAKLFPSESLRQRIKPTCSASIGDIILSTVQF